MQDTAVSEWIFYLCIFGYTMEKIPASSFHLLEKKSQRLARSVALSWNTSINALKSLRKGNDWMLFPKAVLSLLILSLLGGVSLQSLIIKGIPLEFVIFDISIFMRKKSMVLEALSMVGKLKSDIARKFLTSKKDD